ncbi:hypothetical protein NDU88_000422 [Pleurodeles waltl]|uniref:Uncharacterized protein n=1 Tax=Pleurodeles waltl TaxID=8319 RepID=A0AAV7VWG5_PLEWA|nr:hypothetical protein NDU88_000422 [Pleurodeles waltl]
MQRSTQDVIPARTGLSLATTDMQATQANITPKAVIPDPVAGDKVIMKDLHRGPGKRGWFLEEEVIARGRILCSAFAAPEHALCPVSALQIPRRAALPPAAAPVGAAQEEAGRSLRRAGHRGSRQGLARSGARRSEHLAGLGSSPAEAPGGSWAAEGELRDGECTAGRVRAGGARGWGSRPGSVCISQPQVSSLRAAPRFSPESPQSGVLSPGVRVDGAGLAAHYEYVLGAGEQEGVGAGVRSVDTKICRFAATAPPAVRTSDGGRPSARARLVPRCCWPRTGTAAGDFGGLDGVLSAPCFAYCRPSPGIPAHFQ